VNELVKKELRECGVPAAVVLCVITAIWLADQSVSNALVAPRGEPTYAVISTAAGLGVLLGLAQFAGERSRGTVGYLVHREGGRRALFVAKASVGIALALALAMLPPIAFGIAQLFGEFAPVVQPERMFEHAWAGLAAVPAYALGVLIAQCSRSLLASVIAGLLGAFGCIALSLWLPLPVLRMSLLAPLVYAGIECALGALVLAFAWSLFARAFDRDLNFSLRMQLACALLAIPFFVQPAWLSIWYSAVSMQTELFQRYPVLVHDQDAGFRLLGPEGLRQQESELYRSSTGLPNTRSVTLVRPSPGWQPWASGEWHSAQFWIVPTNSGVTTWMRWWPLFPSSTDGEFHVVDRSGTLVRPSSHEFQQKNQLFLDRELGVVRVVYGVARPTLFAPDRDQVPPRMEILRRCGPTQTLSAGTRAFGDFGDYPLLLDPVDQTFWTIDFRGAVDRLAEVALPDGDVLIETRPICETRQAQFGEFRSSGSQVLFVGRKATYVWTMKGFVVPEPGSILDEQQARERIGLEWRLEAPSMVALHVDVRKVGEGAGEIEYQHTFEPSTREEMLLAGAVRLGSLLAPPSTSMLRFAGAYDTPRSGGWNLLLTRTVADTTGFHMLHIALGGLLALAAWLRVARRGGTRAERVLWGVFVALFGVFAFLFLLLLRPRSLHAARTERAQPSTDAPAASLAAT
jgi:hypothetical protein